MPSSSARARSWVTLSFAAASAGLASGSATVSLMRRPKGGEPKRRRRSSSASTKGPGVARGHGLDGGVVGLVGLHDGAPRPISSPGAPDRLGQQLPGALGGTLVGQVEGDVGRDDAHQRDLGDVEALGHEAGAHEHVGGAGGEVVDDPCRGSLALHDIAVEASRCAGPGSAP